MCGRYTIRRIDRAYPQLGITQPFEEFTHHVRFNVAPTQLCPIVRPNSNGELIVDHARWGLIPHWTKGKPKQQPINARCETAASSGMFRHAFGRRRCLAPTDGFYEWHGEKPPKQPYFIRRRGDEPFAFAGLWERWSPDEQAEPVDTFTILTTTANATMQPIHHRMPVILQPADYPRWLDRDTPIDEIVALCQPCADDLLEIFPIGTAVNNVRNDGPELVEPITLRAAPPARVSTPAPAPSPTLF